MSHPELDINGFNTLLKGYMNEVKVLEKTRKKEAAGKWVFICRFIVEFAKSPKCPRNLRPKLIQQAEAILNKAKMFQQGELGSVFSGEVPKKVPSPPKKAEDQNEDAMMNDLLAINIPKDMADGEIVSRDPNIDEKNIVSGPSNIGSATNSIMDLSPKDRLSLEKLDAELRKMPDNMTEIKPTPFGNQTIIPHSQINLNDFKKETQNLDITQASIGGSLGESPPEFPKPSQSPHFKAVGFASEPLKKTAPRDPFGPASVQDTGNPSNEAKVCFACGSVLKPGEKFCPECGTEN
jgi:hypothetical protein